MTLFWVLTGVLSLAVAALLAMALLRGRRQAGPAAAYDLQVYRDQLKEIDRDATRGVIPAEEAERLRTEVSRRILAADAKAGEARPAGGQSGAVSMVASVVMVLVMLSGSFALYTRLGAPGYGDLPRAERLAAAERARTERPSQADAEAGVPAQPTPNVSGDYMELVVRLRQAVEDRPEDIRGLRLLARSEAALGNYRAAYEAQERILSLRGEDATAQDYADLADMMVLAAGGYVSPEAQSALEGALARDPGNGVAQYYGGLMMAQIGRPDIAFRMWDRLLRSSAPDAPWVPPIEAQIRDVAWRAGERDYQLPERAAPAPVEGLPGPSREDMEAAGEMSAEDRTQMVQGMVDRLSTRLAEEGGTPEEWARLIGALGVLGRTEQAQAIYAEAQGVFGETPEAMQVIDEAAARAGLSQ